MQHRCFSITTFSSLVVAQLGQMLLRSMAQMMDSCAVGSSWFWSFHPPAIPQHLTSGPTDAANIFNKNSCNTIMAPFLTLPPPLLRVCAQLLTYSKAIAAAQQPIQEQQQQAPLQATLTAVGCLNRPP
jgi:hypothetical protein